MHASRYRCLLLLNSRLPSHPPFLYIHLHPNPLTANFESSSSSSKDKKDNGVAKESLSTRIIRYGEHKWQQLAQSRPRTPKHFIYRVGNKLIERIPAREWMLWRAYSLSRQFDGIHLYYPLLLEQVDLGATTTPQPKNLAGFAQVAGSTLAALRVQLAEAAKKHRFWMWAHSVSLIPVTVLTVLPFVKLVWAWLAFRAVTHYRASIGAKWLADDVLASDGGNEEHSFRVQARPAECPLDELAKELPELQLLLKSNKLP